MAAYGSAAVPELQQLRDDHADAVLAFETVNRDWFALWVSDRGDAYFEQFATVHAARLREQRDGTGAYFVLVEDDGSVVGRVNLIVDGGDDGYADLGYRIAEDRAGQGLASRAVRAVCELAERDLGLRRITAATAEENLASACVLRKCGFVEIGPADPADLGGKAGRRFERRST